MVGTIKKKMMKIVEIKCYIIKRAEQGGIDT